MEYNVHNGRATNTRRCAPAKLYLWNEWRGTRAEKEQGRHSNIVRTWDHHHTRLPSRSCNATDFPTFFAKDDVVKLISFHYTLLPIFQHLLATEVVGVATNETPFQNLYILICSHSSPTCLHYRSIHFNDCNFNDCREKTNPPSKSISSPKTLPISI